jgi:HEAT repeat protein
MTTGIDNIIHIIIFNGSLSVEISAEDINTLNSLPTDAVFKILKDIYTTVSDRYVRARSYSALMAITNLDKVQFLLEMFHYPPEDMHATYCYELADFDDPRATEQLCHILLSNPDPDLRSIAATSLSKHDDPLAIQALEYAKEHDTGDDFEGVSVQYTAQWALNQIRNRQAVD